MAEPNSPTISILNDDEQLSDAENDGDRTDKAEKKKKGGLGRLFSRMRSTAGRPTSSSLHHTLSAPNGPLPHSTSSSSLTFGRALSLGATSNLSRSTLNLAEDPGSPRIPRAASVIGDEKKQSIPGIRVFLIRGEGLLACDSTGLSDPYCIFKIPKIAKYKTNMQRQTLNPNWHEEFFLPCPEDCAEKLIVDVYDWDAFSRDDYMGSCVIDTATLTSERTEMTVALQNRLSKVVMPAELGTITFVVCRSTDVPKKASIFQRALKDRLVCVEVISAEGVPVLDDVGTIDTYVKVRIGESKQKTKVANRSTAPEWRQRFEFPLHTNSSLLQLILCQSHADPRDKILGRVDCTLDELPRDVPADRNVELTGPFRGIKLHFQVTVSDLYKEENDEATALHGAAADAGTHPEDCAMLEVDVLQARNLRAKDVYGRCDPYVVLDVGNTHVRSCIVNKTLNPAWNKTFKIRVDDVFDELRVAVYDDVKRASLGQIAIPLQKIRNGVPEWHTLRTPDLFRRAGGELHLKLTLNSSMKTTALHLIGRTQRKYMDQSERFSLVLTRLHFHRVVNIVTFLGGAASTVEGLLQWRYGAAPSTIATVLWFIFCVTFEWWYLPALLAAALVFTLIISPYRKPRLTIDEKQFKMFSELQTGEDEEDDENDEEDDGIDEEKTKKSLFARWEEFNQIAASAQSKLDELASFFERIKNLFFWTTPFATAFVLAALLAATLALRLLPLNWIIMAVGLKKLIKSGLRFHGVLPPPALPSYNEATALLARMPSDLDLLRYRSVSPELSRSASLRSRGGPA